MLQSGCFGVKLCRNHLLRLIMSSNIDFSLEITESQGILQNEYPLGTEGSQPYEEKWMQMRPV